MRRVLHEIKRDQDVPLMQCNRAAKLEKAAKTGPQIIVSWQSTFPAELRALPHARFLHLIRDPRDVLLSGMRYHRKAPLGREKFLAEKRDDLGGRTYQGHLNGLPTDMDHYLFETHSKHAQSVFEMLAWGRSGASTVDLRYEDLSTDVYCVQLREILNNFAIKGIYIDRACHGF
ncbi:hypothetical protein OAN307_c32940 [Octadecabacter antarcticus 307]|uniref:Sulfotransferase domain-containing protein n=1 Tax=Octadecabacter antarcticus 307 TaxID=391626 RepID=M9R7Z9_9RHOB|nr:hypothetical protein [Octadecabacter antarcticus]AGI68804.1 hypothetical protein OAN307_c32940 [Octadecabacter antarcticus 307]